eukprot:161062-Rhodomonas_salina.2
MAKDLLNVTRKAVEIVLVLVVVVLRERGLSKGGKGPERLYLEARSVARAGTARAGTNLKSVTVTKTSKSNLNTTGRPGFVAQMVTGPVAQATAGAQAVADGIPMAWDSGCG